MVHRLQRPILSLILANGVGLILGGCQREAASDGEEPHQIVRGPVGPEAVPNAMWGHASEVHSMCIFAAGDRCLRVQQQTEEAVCDRFVQDTLARSRHDVWRPGAGPCEPGRTSVAARTEALGRTNLYRWLMGLPPVVDDSDRMSAVESCALMQSLAGSLEHEPPQSWACWEPEGAAAAGLSNLSLGPLSPSEAVDGLMVDSGEYNAETLGHRRWISRPTLSAVAFGYSAAKEPATCMHLAAQSAASNGSPGVSGLVMWPAPGRIPFEMVHPNNLKGETLRWSVMGEGVDFGAASVVLIQESIPGRPSEHDRVLPVNSGRLLAGVGDGMWLEPGVPLEAGISYRVEVFGSSVGDFRWRTRFVDCGMVVPDPCDPVAQDCPLPGTGCYGQDLPRCMERLTTAESRPCRYMNECDPGHTCVVWGDGDSDCVPYCVDDVDSEASCSERCPQGVRELGDGTDWHMCQRP